MNAGLPHGQQRREHERKLFRTTAALQLPDSPPIPVRTLDISVQGIGIVAPSALPAKSPCIIRFRISERPPIEAHALIIHSFFSRSGDGFISGLQFQGLPTEAQSVLLQFMDGRGRAGRPLKQEDLQRLMPSRQGR